MIDKLVKNFPLPEHTIIGPSGTGTYFNGHTDKSLISNREACAKAVVDAIFDLCAKICDEEADYRTAREKDPLPGDSGPAAQGHKEITARALAEKNQGRKERYV